MYIFNTVEGSSYKLTKCQNSSKMLNNCFQYIRECHNEDCVYNRKLTTLREKYQDKILKLVNEKTNIKILFFGSFLLLQELIILVLLGNRVSEVHFSDYAYANFLKNKTFTMAFAEFLEHTINHNLNVKIYIHSNPEQLKNSKFCKERFDIISGIDFDDGALGNIKNIKEIASNTLKKNGIMLLSQNREDLVDISYYQIKNNRISLIKIVEYIKPQYYYYYWLQYQLMQLLRPFNFLLAFSMLLVFPSIAFASLFFYSLYYLNIGKKLYHYKHKILDYRTLLVSD